MAKESTIHFSQGGKTFFNEIDQIIYSLEFGRDKKDIIKDLEESKKQDYELRREPEVQETTPTGWKCPVCGGGNSPYATRCPCIPYYEPPYVTPTYPIPYIPNPSPHYTICWGY